MVGYWQSMDWSIPFPAVVGAAVRGLVLVVCDCPCIVICLLRYPSVGTHCAFSPPALFPLCPAQGCTLVEAVRTQRAHCHDDTAAATVPLARPSVDRRLGAPPAGVRRELPSLCVQLKAAHWSSFAIPRPLSQRHGSDNGAHTARPLS